MYNYIQAQKEAKTIPSLESLCIHHHYYSCICIHIMNLAPLACISYMLVPESLYLCLITTHNKKIIRFLLYRCMEGLMMPNQRKTH